MNNLAAQVAHKEAGRTASFIPLQFNKKLYPIAGGVSNADSPEHLAKKLDGIEFIKQLGILLIVRHRLLGVVFRLRDRDNGT